MTYRSSRCFVFLSIIGCLLWLSSCTHQAPERPSTQQQKPPQLAQPSAQPQRPAQQAAQQQPQQAVPSGETPQTTQQQPQQAVPPVEAPQSAPSAQASAPVVEPVPTVAESAAPSPASATEKYRLRIRNFAKTPVTVSINGVLLGQWDSIVDVPLDSVLKGENQLKVKVEGEPKNELQVSVYTKRDGYDMQLASLDFKGKTGTLTHSFLAR